MNTDIKFGTDGVAKYHQLLHIEEELYTNVNYSELVALYENKYVLTISLMIFILELIWDM